MRKLIVTLAACFALAGAARAAESAWLTDLPKALEKARAEKKHVLVNFTGSDW